MTGIEFKLSLIEDVIRLRRAQADLPLSRDLAKVRANLEERIGETVSQRVAARVLGVSHTAIQRWIATGDLPVVINQKGRKAVPTNFITDLAMKIDRDRSESGRNHPIEPVMSANRKRAQAIRQRETDYRTHRSDDAHRRAADFALEYHRAVARQLSRDQVNEALRTVWRRRDQGLMHSKYADDWEKVLAGNLNEIKSTITLDSEFGEDLRQNSPFAGTLSEPERAEVFALTHA